MFSIVNTFFAAIFAAFIPLFMAIDALGTVPFFLALTEGLDDNRRKEIIAKACITALLISVVFLLFGKFIFHFMGITEDDFRIGGGILLLVLAITDLLFPQTTKNGESEKDLAIFPIAVPLIVGPSALTTILINVEGHGYVPSLISLAANLAIVWLVFRQSKHVLKYLGSGGAKAVAKVASIFLAAIAVMMIRVGVTHLFNQPPI